MKEMKRKGLTSTSSILGICVYLVGCILIYTNNIEGYGACMNIAAILWLITFLKQEE